MLLLASITDKLVEVATNVVGDLGLLGVFVLMVPESACIPIPSEATMLFAGFNVARGHYPLWEPVLVGVAANVIGSWVAYAIGYYGRIDLLEKHGRALHVKQKHLDWAFARMVPIVRTFISLPAGVARMPFWRFTLLTLAGCVPWVFMLAFIGREAGSHWDRWKDKLHYVDYAVLAAIAIGVVYLIVSRRRRAAAV